MSQNKAAIGEHRQISQDCFDLADTQTRLLASFRDNDIAELRVAFNNVKSGAAVDRVVESLNECAQLVNRAMRTIGENFRNQADAYVAYDVASEESFQQLLGRVQDGSAAGGAGSAGPATSGPTGLAVSYNI